MPKNIVLCADGTGNQGGHTPDTNVYKLYKSVDIFFAKDEEGNPVDQINFYDNGVGTAKNKIRRAIGGGLGFGFGQNVCDLYEFIARHYDTDDRVFLFGFSRGAAEVRALSGFIATCGLLHAEHKRLSQNDFRTEVERVFDIYKKQGSVPDPEMARDDRSVIPIEFIGVWDTVSALGFPRRWNKTTILMQFFSALFSTLDRTLDFGWFKHRFYNYSLTPNVKSAYHALALDDERNSFRPEVWDECSELLKKEDGWTTQVEQVWFAGMHSNVGGGYQRAGLANVTMDWMMHKARKHGLIFEEQKTSPYISNAKKHSTPFGRLYDSRDGLAIFYRYHPREIETDLVIKSSKRGEKSRSKLRGKIMVHESVIARMKRRTGNYTPYTLPAKFQVVYTGNSKSPQNYDFENNNDWKRLRKEVNKWIVFRKWLYAIQLELTLLVLGLTIYLWNRPPGDGSTINEKSQWISGILPQWLTETIPYGISEILRFLTPAMFDNIIKFSVVDNPQYLLSVIIFFTLYTKIRKTLWLKTKLAAEKSRKLVRTYTPGSP